MSTYCIVHDDKLPALGCHRVSFLIPGVTQETECDKCGTKILHGGKDEHVAAFCSTAHFNEGKVAFLREIPDYASMPSEVPNKSNKPKSCPTCGGASTRGRGFAHTKDCSESSINKAVAASVKRKAALGNCPDCGGPPGKRRGWVHTEGCSRGKEVKPVSDPCTECGGPARGRGYSHVEGCSILVNREASKPRPVAGKKRRPRRKFASI